LIKHVSHRARFASGIAQSWSRERSAPFPGCPGGCPGHLENLCFPYRKHHFSILRAVRVPRAEPTVQKAPLDTFRHPSPPPLLSFSHPSKPPFRSPVLEHRAGSCPPRRAPRGVGGLEWPAATCADPKNPNRAIHSQRFYSLSIVALKSKLR